MSGRFEHRKQKALLTLVDKEGRPLNGKEVSFHQTRHDFLFGFGAFDAVEVASEDTLLERKYELMDRLSKMMAVFNYGTLPFYWGRFEPHEGEPITEATLKGAQWLKARGVKT